MNAYLWSDGAGFEDLPLGSPSRMDYTLDFLNQELDEEITTIQQPPINFGSESNQGGMGHFEQEFTNFPWPLTDQTLGPYFSHLVDHPMLSDPQAAPCFTTPQLPGNIGSDQYSEMIFESGLGSTESLRPPSPSVAPIFDNPLMEIVLRAPSSSSGQTRRATPHRTYKKFTREDVEELNLAVLRYGTCWKSIAEIPRFKEQGRTALQLLNKWRDMTKDADIKRKDPDMNKLYIGSRNVKWIREEMN